MATESFIHVIPYLLSAGTSAAIGAYAWGRKSVPGSRQFAVLAMAQFVATVGFIFELSSASLQSKIFWENVQTIALLVWPVAYLAFAIRFTDRQFPDRKIVWAALAAPFVVFLALLFTDPLHELIRQQPHLEAGAPFDALIFGYAWPIYLVGIYSYGFIISAIYLLGKKFISPSPIYRGQVGTVMAGTMIPVVVGILTAAGVRLVFQRDPTPITFALSNLIVAWGLYRYRLFDVVPVARDSLVESMRDGVMVLDLHNRIVDVNPAAQQMLGSEVTSLVGQSADSSLAPWPALLTAAANSKSTHFEMSIEYGAVLEVSLEPIDERRGLPSGRMFVLRDITEHKAMELELEQALGRSEQRLTQFLDALPVAVVVYGPDTKPRFANQLASKMIGPSQEGEQEIAAPDTMPLSGWREGFPVYVAG